MFGNLCLIIRGVQQEASCENKYQSPAVNSLSPVPEYGLDPCVTTSKRPKDLSSAMEMLSSSLCFQSLSMCLGNIYIYPEAPFYWHDYVMTKILSYYHYYFLQSNETQKCMCHCTLTVGT